MNKKNYESPMFDLFEVQLTDCLAISKISGDPEDGGNETPLPEIIETVPGGGGGFFDDW